ncbi:MAG: hypothetical protein M0R32_11540 [Candidatus Cloacimonetes bacterium]|jgi:hypothetical protein|nr:hypothetical protein [Candidatus Cloacimonadota bacterium]
MKLSSIHPVFFIAGIFALVFSLKIALILFAVDYVAWRIEKHIQKKKELANER